MWNARVKTSALIFFAYAALGSFGPYINLFYQDQGMSLIKVGVLAMIPASMSMLAGPTWSALADRFHLHKYLLPFTIALSLPFGFLISTMHTFGQLLVGITLFAACYSAIVPLSDSAILTNLGDQPNQYGRIRLWGSIGVAAASWTAGILAQSFHLNTVFYFYIILAAIAAGIAVQLPKAPHIPVESFWKSAAKFVRDESWVIFLCGAALSGFAHMFLGYYFFIFIRTLGASDSYIGFLVVVACLTNILVFFMMPRLLKHWTAIQLILFSNVLLILRMILSAFIHDAQWGILVQLMDGPTWGIMWAAGVNYANEIAPRGLLASSQAVFNGVFNGLGGMVGALLGGIIYSSWGDQILFLIGGALAVISVLVFLPQLKVGFFSRKEMVREKIE